MGIIKTKRMQNILTILSLLSSIVFFIYALGFSTNWALSKLVLKDFNKSAQSFNHSLYTLSLIAILISVVMFLFNTHRRKRYYNSNLIFGLASPSVNILVAVFIIVSMPSLKTKYLAADLSTTHLENSFTKSTFTFDLGTILSIVVTVISVFMIVMVLVKFLTQTKKKIVSFSSSTNNKEVNSNE